MPETFEQYRHRVLEYLGDRDPIRVQRTTASALARRVHRLPRRTLTWTPATGKWSIIEIIGHMADAELAMGWRLRRMIASPGVALDWWDQDVWARRLDYANGDVRVYLDLFRSLRAANLRVLMALAKREWTQCYGEHETRGRQTVADFVALEAAHDLNHLRQIDHILNASHAPPKAGTRRR